MVYKKLALNTAFLLCIGILANFSNPAIMAVGPHDTATQDEPDLCAVCTEELNDTASRPQVFFDCGQKALHSYHLDCVNILLSKNYKKCPLCDKPTKFFNPLVKVGDYTRVHGLDRNLTPNEQKELKSFLAKWAGLVSKNPFPTINKPAAPKTEQPATPQQTTPTRPQQTAPQVNSETSHREPSKAPQEELPTDFLATLTEQQKKELFDMPIAKEVFPPIELSEEDVKLNSELPLNLDPKEWQVIITQEGKRLRARRAERLTQWPPKNLEAPLHASSFVKQAKVVREKLKGTPGDLATGFLLGLLTGREFESAKQWPNGSEEEKMADEKNLSFRRLMYTPAIAGGIALNYKLNPGRKIDTKVGINWALGYALGVCLHLFVRP